MPFEIVRNDITNMCVDVIVNTANPRPVVGAGTDSAIHQAAGEDLLKARQRIGNIAPGDAAITPAFRLHAQYVIHTVGPMWIDGRHQEETLLRRCYDHSLALALEHGCHSIAFPLISSGNYGFPKDMALQIAIAAFSQFLLEHEMQIYLVVFDQAAYKLSEQLFQAVASYIDENYVDEYRKLSPRSCRINRRQDTADFECKDTLEEIPDFNLMRQSAPIMAEASILSLEEMLQQTDAGFTETLLHLIDKTGKKDSEIYKKANVSKQHFSKIRNNPHYNPTKPTAIALALALELDLDATKDLIGRAGYALTNSSKFDLIIRYFIEHKKFNIVEINLALYEFDQPLLGGSL